MCGPRMSLRERGRGERVEVGRLVSWAERDARPAALGSGGMKEREGEKLN
jgi:hypothetical protein